MAPGPNNDFEEQDSLLQYDGGSPNGSVKSKKSLKSNKSKRSKKTDEGDREGCCCTGESCFGCTELERKSKGEECCLCFPL